MGLVALALGGFGIGLTEFVIAGLLPQVAKSFAVSEAAAGWLISGYALSVAVGAIGLTAATARLPRKRILVALAALFVAGNLLSAVAPSYLVMLLGRIVAALCHGSFFGVGSVVAASLVAPERRASAVAAMFSGLTIANIGGVPLAAWVGQHVGWRAAFAGIGGFTVSKLMTAHGIGFPIGPLVGALAATAIGLLAALPALRVRGVNLAIVTLAAAATVENLVFKNTAISGGARGRTRARPKIPAVIVADEGVTV